MEKKDIERLIQSYRFDKIKELIDKDPDYWETIKAIGFSISLDQDKKKYFRCAYSHHTDHFDKRLYELDYDSSEDVKNKKTTQLEFGYNLDGFYISSSVIDVYSNRESPNVPIPFNRQYEYKLEESEQAELMDRYADNKNIPEWFAISFFKSIGSEIDEFINSVFFA